jgi:hypothetical protein
VPPDALPYIIGSYTMNTIRLKSFLGRDYETIIHFTIEDALADSFNLASQTPEKLTASTVVGQPL